MLMLTMLRMMRMMRLMKWRRKMVCSLRWRRGSEHIDHEVVDGMLTMKG